MRRLSLIMAAILACLGIQAQNASQELMRYAGNIHQFNRLFPQEKVYVQFDNTSYYTGETIWFKAFVVEASTLHRTPSGVLYVDLISPTGVILKQQKLKIVAGQADGSFPLYDGSTAYARDLRGVLSYPSGFYEIRAYTTNMQNFREETIFSRVLPVFEKPSTDGNFYGEAPIIKEHYNKDANIEQFRPKTDYPGNAINVTFYPEGGNIISRIPNRVAFKVTDKNGMGIEAEGRLNDTIPIKTVHDGMGSFVFTPLSTTNRATLTFDGKSHTFTLPDVSDHGYAIMADIVDDTLRVSVNSNGLMVDDTLGLTLTCRGELMTFENVPLRNGKARIVSDCDRIPEGICQITLFDRQGNIFARRSIYHRSDAISPDLTFTASETKPAPFSPIQIKFKLCDGNGNALRDRFCLSVRDKACPGTAIHDDLRTALLLSSDLRGYIYNPEYYFEQADEDHDKALDLLMMVQGWERYDWETMSGVKPYKEIHRLEDSLSVNGWIESPWSRKPMDSIVVTAAITTMDKKMIERFRYTTGPDGYFGFNISDFYDAARLTISAWPKRKRIIGTSARIRFERSMKPSIRAYSPIEILLADASGRISSKKKRNETTLDTKQDNFPTVVQINDGILLPEVDIKEKRMYIDYFTFKAFNVHQDTELELDLGEYSTNVANYLLDKGYAVNFDLEGNIEDINGHTPFFYVHETEKAVVKGLFESPGLIDTKDIRSIMVFDDVMYETDAMKLSPLLQTYRRKHGDYDTPETMLQKEHNRVLMVDILLKEEAQRATRRELKNINSRVTTVDGFSSPYEFYSPQYTEAPIYGDVDYRRTLYWNPNVITDVNGEAEVNFYNNSYSTGFCINGAGITASGVPYTLDSVF